MIEITATPLWRATFPGAAIGLLEIADAGNELESRALDERKLETENRLRRDWAGRSRQDILSHPVMAAYERYYRRFDKTYHVQLQVESIALKGKSLPHVSPLVDANFSAEVGTFVLTAGHDAEKLDEPVVIDVSREDDAMTPMNGPARLIKAGDMVMRDRHSVCCSIIYGQDNRSPITVGTQHVLYVAYAPPGVPAAAVEAQLQRIEENIRLFAPLARVEQSRLLAAGIPGG